MFFVGATGQLLTLLLTVSIPFMMLISGHQKTNFHQKNLRFEVEQSSEFYLNIDKQADSVDFFCSLENQKNSSVFYPEKLIYMPPDISRASWKMIYLENIGNKAPPHC